MGFVFADYVAPQTLGEAYEILTANKFARLIGGGCFIRLGRKRIGLAVDLVNCNLDYIKDTGDEIEIGAMTSLRTIETSQVIKDNFGPAIANSLRHIIGVQLRNIATIGASLYSKYGFSDPLTMFLALDADIVLYGAGRMTLEDFLLEKEPRRDILEKVVLKKNGAKGSFQTLRTSAVDYGILNLGLAKLGKDYRLAIGARPRRASLAYGAMEILSTNELSEEIIDLACDRASRELEFGSNTRASGEYRRELAKVLTKRAIKELGQ